jgi:hypothetical protein
MARKTKRASRAALTAELPQHREQNLPHLQLEVGKGRQASYLPVRPWQPLLSGDTGKPVLPQDIRKWLIRCLNRSWLTLTSSPVDVREVAASETKELCRDVIHQFRQVNVTVGNLTGWAVDGSFGGPVERTEKEYLAALAALRLFHNGLIGREAENVRRILSGVMAIGRQNPPASGPASRLLSRLRRAPLVRLRQAGINILPHPAQRCLEDVIQFVDLYATTQASHAVQRALPDAVLGPPTISITEKKRRSKRRKADEGKKSSASSADTVAQKLKKLTRNTQPLDRDGGAWVSNKVAARLEGIGTRTLTDYRFKGIQTPQRDLGQDQFGRIWRREGTACSHPWYLRSSLKGKN